MSTRAGYLLYLLFCHVSRDLIFVHCVSDSPPGTVHSFFANILRASYHLICNSVIAITFQKGIHSD